MAKDVEEVITSLLAAAPTIGPAWQEHLNLWEGEDRGGYSDISVLARHLVQLVADGQDAEARSIFGVVEENYASNPSAEVTNLLTVGLIEDIQNLTAQTSSPIGSSAFVPLLGPLTTAAWNDQHQAWGTTDT